LLRPDEIAEYHYELRGNESVPDTNRTMRAALMMSVPRGRPEVIGGLETTRLTRNGNFALESGHRVDVCRLDKGLLVRDAG
jgi:hypothetical protein